MNAPTPWAAWMRVAFGVMGLPPEAFWSLSFREWTLALEGLAGAHGVAVAAPLSRAELERLIEEDSAAPLRAAPPGNDRRNMEIDEWK